MMGEQSNRAKSIFLAAIDEQTPEQWPTFLEHACGGDASLRAEVERLLHAQAALGSFHEAPRSALVETVDHLPAERPGSVIGPYRLLHPISEGGMGVVYAAEQDKPVRRRAALKIIKPGMDSRQVLARFEAERQALALMDHPNIARVLDAGCGTGEHALFLAARGLRVVGLDFVDEAIRRARRKAAERGLKVEFLVKDATALGDLGERFATAIDCGLFHCFSDDDRRRYVAGLAHVLQPGGRLFLMTFSDEEPGTDGPRRVSRQELYDAFADGWEVESVQPCRIEITPEFTEVRFSEGGPKAWFAVIRRKA
jgi:SAM-dependent methyltransferase